MDTLPDNALMLKVKGGDIDKMSLLYERHHHALYKFIFHMTQQKESSEDLVQNVFLRMLKYRESFMGTGEFKTWMYHIARNILNDYYRKNKKIPSHYNVEDFEERIEGEHFADTRIEKKQELKTLAMAMESLSKENRELLILCRYQELKYHEVALILGITETAVKVRVHRALIALKSHYIKIAN